MNFSPFRVPQTLVKTFAQVHVTDRVNAFNEFNGSGQLAVPVAPVVLDALQMPLVDNNDNFLALCAVNFVEKLFITLIDANSLPLGEEIGHGCNIPVHEVLIHTLL